MNEEILAGLSKVREDGIPFEEFTKLWGYHLIPPQVILYQQQIDNPIFVSMEYSQEEIELRVQEVIDRQDDPHILILDSLTSVQHLIGLKPAPAVAVYHSAQAGVSRGIEIPSANTSLSIESVMDKIYRPELSYTYNSPLKINLIKSRDSIARTVDKLQDSKNLLLIKLKKSEQTEGYRALENKGKKRRW